MSERWKKLICVILSAALLVGNIPASVFAAEEDGLCEHHTVHTDCGYAAAVEGSACTHRHTNECYETATQCAHIHGDCGYSDIAEENQCPHECTEESTCVSHTLNCGHVHDEACGYRESAAAQPCGYVCEECESMDTTEEHTEEPQPEEVPVQSVMISQEDGIREIAVGETLQLTALVLPENAVDKIVVWCSSNETVATVDENGKVTAIAPGTAEITASCGEVQESYFLSVIAQMNETVMQEAEQIDMIEYVPATVVNAAKSGECGEGVTWSIVNGTLTISGSGLVTSRPWYNYWKDITRLVIREGVEFEYNSNIGNFGMCSNLTSAYLEIKCIINSMFSGRTSLQSVVFGNKVEHIGQNAFGGCTGLTEVTLPESVTEISHYAFDQCENLTSINIPQGVSKIEENTFRYCSSLNSITMPNSVTSIGDSAFAYCSSLSSVSIPDSVTSIGDSAFYYCSSLSSVSIPDSVTSIGDSAFYYCSSLSSVTIPYGVTSIGDSAFYGCSSLSSVTIPYGVTSIGDSAFAYCSSLSSVTIPDSVTSIGVYAFNRCSSLSSITIPDSVTSIDQYAFAVCENLRKVMFTGNAPKIAENAFESVSTTAYYPADNATWTEEVRQNYGGDITWVPLGKGNIALSITEEHIRTDPMICGTVDSSGEAKTMQPLIKGSADQPYYDVEMDFTLPEGFSFSETELVTEMKYTGEWTKLTDSIEMVPIYPIYMDPSDQQEAYAMSVAVTATDAKGNTTTSVQELVFYVPESSDNIAEAACQNIKNAEPYVFSLDNTVGGGTAYNQETARLCAMMADMAYNNEAMETFLTQQMGFSDCLMLAQASEQEVLRYYATKQVIIDGKIKNIVYAVFRGTVTTEEWKSNLNAGLQNMHEGFGETASCVQKELVQYCTARGFTKENTIIVMTGHSRGAAVANILGKWMNANGQLAEKENISVYTFATPTVDRSVITEEDGSRGNENIFNYVYYQDAIRNAPSMQYYGRYGRTIIFGYSVAPEDANTLSDGYSNYSVSLGDANFTLCELANAILYQTEVGTVMEELSVWQTICDFTILFELAMLVYPSVLPNQAVEILMRPHEMQNYYSAVTKNAQGTSFSIVNKRTEDAYKLVDNFAKAQGLLFELHKFKCPINVYVYDAQGNQVASIVDKKAACTDDRISLFVENDTLNVCYLDKYANDFSIRVEGYDDGTMKHGVLTSSFGNMEAMQLREDIPIEKGGSLEVNADGMILLPGETEEETISAYTRYENEDEMERILEEFSNSNTEDNKFCIIIPPTDINEVEYVFVDGVEYQVIVTGNTRYVEIPSPNAKTMIAYTWHEDEDVHGRYPVGMQVWSLSNENGIYTATRVEELDDLLRYGGMSIRIQGKRGIRMITGMDVEDKKALTEEGLAGYTLREYGTLVAWSDQLSDTKPLVLGKPYVRSNYAYRKDVTDMVLQEENGVMQYTNVLVNFTDAQCKKDLSMRSYAILADATGNTVTLYGGIVQRSIGYIARQNEGAYAPDTEEYQYIMELLQAAYGSE